LPFTDSSTITGNLSGYFLKLWHGESHHEAAYEQLANYLKSKNMDCGYLLTFDFRKKGDDRFAKNKWVDRDGKRIFDIVLRVGKR